MGGITVMAQRTVALCDGKYIGIESIYTVINGRQINIPDKLKELRIKSQNNELYCPCGCGANLILVAGDNNLREQHFRIKDADRYKDCHMVTEGKTSVESKIVLKCWLDDNLHADDLESRVPISSVSDSNRKYEFSFISRKFGIALNYCHDRANLSDEKLQILEDNSSDIHIIHVVDSLNGGISEQSPERMMKIQTRQQYCLFLSVKDSDYDKAELEAAFYDKDALGFWKKIVFWKGRLKEYKISTNGSVSIHGRNLTELKDISIKNFYEEVAEERKRREESEKRIAEYLKQQQLEEEREKKERLKRQEEEQRREAEEEERQRLEKERAIEEKHKRYEIFKQNLADNLNQQSEPVIDPDGNRWFKCEYCGKMAKEPEFSSYGGKIGIHFNLGTCKECAANNPEVELDSIKKHQENKRKFDPTICPECGGKLIERSGRNGRFIGCSGFPKCRYTRSIRKY